MFSVNKTYNDLKSTGLIVAKNTLYDYMSFLEDASLVFQVPVYSHSIKEQQRNPKKIYIIDNGYHTLVSVKQATLINAEVEENLETDSGTINIIPLWKWLLV